MVDRTLAAHEDVRPPIESDFARLRGLVSGYALVPATREYPNSPKHKFPVDTDFVQIYTTWTSEMFDREIRVEDGERGIEFHLRVEGVFRPAQRCRPGWTDGGDPGERSAWELARTWCLGLRISSGKRVVEAEVRRRRDQRRLGDWCSAEYHDEIVRQLGKTSPERWMTDGLMEHLNNKQER